MKRIKERGHAKEDSEDFWGVKNRGKRKRAIATKAIQVCFSLLLEFLPMFDFSACLFLNVCCIVDFVWTKRATNCFVDIGCLFIFVPNLFVISPISLSPLKNHEMWLYLILISHVCSPWLLFILYHACFVFLLTRPMAINSSYGGDSKAWACNHEIQQRDQPLHNSG